jgi:hypothetical protein
MDAVTVLLARLAAAFTVIDFEALTPAGQRAEPTEVCLVCVCGSVYG